MKLGDILIGVVEERLHNGWYLIRAMGELYEYQACASVKYTAGDTVDIIVLDPKLKICEVIG